MPGGGAIKPMSHEVIDNRENYIRMDGRAVFRFAARTLGRSLRRVLADANLSPNDIDLFIPHQANHRIVEAAARLMGVPEDRFYMNISRYGNTSAASIPLALAEAVSDGRIRDGQLILLEAMGGGFTWGSTLLRW